MEPKKGRKLIAKPVFSTFLSLTVSIQVPPGQFAIVTSWKKVYYNSRLRDPVYIYVKLPREIFMTPLTLGDIARMVDGQLSGDDSLEITGAAILRDVEEGEISFVDRPELVSRATESAARAILASDKCEIEGIPYITVPDVQKAFTLVVAHFSPPAVTESVGISPQAIISPSARLAEGVHIHPGTTIGDDVEIGSGTIIYPGVHIMTGCRIGENVTLFPGVVLYEKTEVGPRCILHSNAVIGAYGFGYDNIEGRHILSAQLGNVILESDVEVGATTTIDRGTYGPTVIGEGTKIDNRVMIGHNCIIGRHNILCSQVGIAGSTTTGDYVVMGGQAGVRDHVHIGAGATLGAKAGVPNDIPEGQFYFGSPAAPQRQMKLQLVSIIKLPEMRRTLKKLVKTVAQLEQAQQTAIGEEA